jgi:YidC/Oxa1 family membrane protein insertase
MQQNNGLDKKQMISFAVLCWFFWFYVLFPKQTIERRGVKAQQQKTNR